MMYIFRNNTIEQFFGSDCQFSGYGDVSIVPEADSYVWCYQVPLLAKETAQEVEMIGVQLHLVLSQIALEKPFYVFTLVNMFYDQVETGNSLLEQQIAYFNSTLYNLAAKRANIRVIEFQEFLSQVDHSKLIDWRYFYIAQLPMSPSLIMPFKRWWQHKLNQIALKRKKCLVLDLDNTLWYGILGEDGVNGVQMSGDYPGIAFHNWQEQLLALKESGVMLAICSKNNVEDVVELWNKRTDVVLKESDFVAMRINWQDKATNLKELAIELNIGLDSFVFIDDNPTEREFIKQTLPMVIVPEFPEQPYNLPVFYQHITMEYFAVYKVTDEDQTKTIQYATNIARRQAATSYSNMEDYLRSLEMQLHVTEISEATLPRTAQMTQKTNQFNLTTHRYTESDIQNLLAEGAIGYTLSVKDKFGDNGITGLMIVTKNGVVDTMLISCRVLGKGIEEAFVRYVLSDLKKRGIYVVEGKYIPTAKNNQVANFWDRMGFTLIEHHKDGCTTYTINLQNADFEIKDYYKFN